MFILHENLSGQTIHLHIVQGADDLYTTTLMFSKAQVFRSKLYQLDCIYHLYVYENTSVIKLFYNFTSPEYLFFSSALVLILSLLPLN